MNLLNKYQSRVFQFALDLLARLEHAGELSAKELEELTRRNGLDYAGQVTEPLIRAGILEREGRGCRLAPEMGGTRLPAGEWERDYLAYILTLPEAELFLAPATREVLNGLGGDPGFFDGVEYHAPAGEDVPENPGAVGFRTLLDAIRGGRMIRYHYRTREDDTYRECVMTPWKLEYSAYDRRWWVILYDGETKRTIKARLENLKDITFAEGAAVTREEIAAAMDRLLAPEPVVLQVDDVRNVLERCFLAFENQMFEETRQQPGEGCRISFRYYRFDEGEILRRLLYLGPDVKLMGPESLRQKLLALVKQARRE